MQFMYKLTVGDWSGDGHDQTYDVYFKSNLTADEVRTAYLETVKKSGVGLHNAGPKSKTNPKPHRAILCDYEDNSIASKDVTALKKSGVDMEFNSMDCATEDDGSLHHVFAVVTAELFLRMAKAARPDFEYKVCDEDIECVNVNGSKDVRMGIGYGVLGH